MRKMLRQCLQQLVSFAIALVGFAAASCFVTAPPSIAQNKIPGDFYPGDAVRIVVWPKPGSDKTTVEKTGIANDYLIDRRGNIFLPLIGDVKVVGLRRDELANVVAERYREFTTGVLYVCKPLIRITVLGAINRPGSYLVEESNSLWQVIDEAGGPAPIADLNKMFIRRGDRIVADKLLAKYESAYSLQEIGVRSGDQLYVAQRSGFHFKTILDYGSFFISAIVLYFQVKRETGN